MLIGTFLLNLIEKHHMLALNLYLFLIVHLEGEFLGFLTTHYLNIGQQCQACKLACRSAFKELHNQHMVAMACAAD